MLDLLEVRDVGLVIVVAERCRKWYSSFDERRQHQVKVRSDVLLVRVYAYRGSKKPLDELDIRRHTFTGDEVAIDHNKVRFLGFEHSSHDHAALPVLFRPPF